MNKYVKGALVFTCGAVVGTVVGGVSVISVAVRIGSIRKAVTKEIARRLCNSIYGAPKISYKNYVFDKPIFDSRSDAHRVLDALNDIIDKYGYASVADLYDLSDMPPRNYKDNKYGWTTIKNAYVFRIRDGYTISLPWPLAIN